MSYSDVEINALKKALSKYGKDNCIENTEANKIEDGLVPTNCVDLL